MCLPLGGACGVDHPGLGDEAEGPLGVATGGHLGLAGGHLFERPAHVDGPGLAARRGLPGHWPAQRPVDLADARAVAEPPSAAR